jgi:hypothetical protein
MRLFSSAAMISSVGAAIAARRNDCRSSLASDHDLAENQPPLFRTMR